MTAMDGEYDFLSACTVGAVLRTRDRREATITGIDRDAGLIHGEVTMIGACRWRRDGVYADAPFGAAGPLDLVRPSEGPVQPRKRTSVTDELAGEGRAFCCD
jgi:hypothetical protein